MTTEEGLLGKPAVALSEEDIDIVKQEVPEEIQKSYENKPADIQDLEKNTNKPKGPTVKFSLGKALKTLGKNLPLVGAGVGAGIGAYYMAKPLEAFAVTGDETEEELRKLRLQRAGTEFAAGVSPVPEPAALNLLNVLPGVSGINIQSAGELVAPTAEEAKARSKLSSDKSSLTTQMDNLFN